MNLTAREVKAIGPIEAKIIFVGEAPGEEEDNFGIPFIGSAGQLLTRTIRSTGLVPSECILANIFLQRPPGNQVEHYFQDKDKRILTSTGQEHVNRLEKFLSKLNPNIVVALGSTALLILTGRKRISKWRGSLLPCILKAGVKVYPMNHPSAIQRAMNDRKDKEKGQNLYPTFMIDLQRVKAQSLTKDIPMIKRNFEAEPLFTESIQFIKNLLSNPKDQYTAIDIETIVTSKGPVMWKFGIATSSTEAISIPFLAKGAFCMTEEEETELVFYISKLFQTSHIKKIFQSNLYDLDVLKTHYNLEVNPETLEDTRWLHHSISPFTLNGLDYLTSIYTWESYYKDDTANKLGSRSDLEEGIYNCRDCCITYEIFFPARTLAKVESTWEGYQKTMSIMPSLLSMMNRGVKINLVKKEELKESYQKIVDTMNQEIGDLIGTEINIRSSKQKADLLYGMLKMKKQYHSRTKELTTDKGALIKLKRLYPKNEILDLILEAQKYNTLISSFLNMRVSPEGRVYTKYDFTNTWRLRSSKGNFGYGSNLQNVPKKSKAGKAIREMFMPDEGKVMLAVDYSQAEARVVAYESEDIEDIEAFETSAYDIHWERAKKVFNLPLDKEYNPDEFYKPLELSLSLLRDYTKIIVHGTNYGMTKRALKTNLELMGYYISELECQKLLDNYKRKKPCLVSWHRTIRTQLKENRYLISSIGRKRFFMGRFNEDMYRAAYAFGPQNTVGEMLERGTQAVHDQHPYIEKLLNVHDELISQVYPKDVEKAIEDIRKCMTIPLEIKGRAMVIPCDFKTGKSWGELKDLE